MDKYKTKLFDYFYKRYDCVDAAGHEVNTILKILGLAGSNLEKVHTILCLQQYKNNENQIRAMDFNELAEDAIDDAIDAIDDAIEDGLL